MKETYYFSHDSNAKSDPKIMAMISDYGMEGYGRYWVVIEMLREADNFKLPMKKYVINALAMQTQCEADAMQSYVDSCINDFELFESDGNFFWSNSLIKRMKKMNEKSEQAKKAAKARWEKRSNDKVLDDSAHAEQSERNADAKRIDANKIKESKVKENKNKDKDIKPSSRRKKIYDEESIHFQLALRLFEKIRSNNPNHKKPDLHKWADDVRLMMEKDDRTSDQISFLIDWCQQDSFWKTNILSARKLKDKFDQLTMVYKEQRKKAQSRSNVTPFKNSRVAPVPEFMKKGIKTNTEQSQSLSADEEQWLDEKLKEM